MTRITLADMLAARERRSALRTAMRREHGGVCLSLSLNIPGAEKDTDRIRALFWHAVARVSESFHVRARHCVEEATGPYAVFCLAQDPAGAKSAARRIEEEGSYGRLLDLDVYGPDGEPVREGKGRRCFLCERPAAVCMREQAHSPQELAAAVEKMFADFAAHTTPDAQPVRDASAVGSG